MVEGFKWENRRKWVARVFWGCGIGWGCVLVALFLPWVTDAKITAVAMPLAVLTGSNIASYIFGAAYENVKGGR
jgi:hypothetical protein